MKWKSQKPSFGLVNESPKEAFIPSSILGRPTKLIMKQVTNIYDPVSFVTEVSKSYAMKRELYNEYQKEQTVRGFAYTKTEFMRDKFPRIPIKLRKILIEKL